MCPTLMRAAVFLGPSPQTKDSMSAAWECSRIKLTSTPMSFTWLTSSISRFSFSRSLGMQLRRGRQEGVEESREKGGGREEEEGEGREKEAAEGDEKGKGGTHARVGG